MLVIPLAALSTGGGTSRPTGVALHSAPVASSATAEVAVPVDTSPIVDAPMQVETAAVAPSAPAATPPVTPTAPPPHTAKAAAVAAGVVAPPSSAASLSSASSGASPQPKNPPTTTRPQPAAAPTSPAPANTQHSQSGPASYYDEAPSGTCAHPTLPFGTVVSIVDTDNNRTASCTVQDRGPYAGGRIIDLARDVFMRMAPTSAGVINVRISW
ncbi:MAG: hypothetical protein NVSMB4_09330 [Acidimicrobiales bacterium]